jgi:hypothetical protein
MVPASARASSTSASRRVATRRDASRCASLAVFPPRVHAF